MKTVSDYMSHRLIVLSGESSVKEAVECMRQNSVSSVIVKNADDALLGIFTERDFLLKIDLSNPQSLTNVPLKNVMTVGVKTLPHHEPYLHALQVMKKNGIRHLPVQKDGKTVGMVSMRDLLNQYNDHLESLLLNIMTGFATAIERKDPFTAGHQKRVAEVAEAIGLEMSLPPHQVNGIRLASIIHDIGKLQIPTEILCKPGPLNKSEYTLVQEHAIVGHDILKSIEFEWPIANIVLQHHERLDGSGYPDGLKGDNILLEARIIAVADVIEAIVSGRPYRSPSTKEAAIHEIRRNRSSLYDPAVVDACIHILEDNRVSLFHTTEEYFSG